MKEFRSRIIMIVGVLALSIYLLYPTFADIQNSNKIEKELSIYEGTLLQSNPTILESELNDMLLIKEDSMMIADP
ncbi:MAG: protein translocase subunit SecD, partial [Melioribacteraceae bacterium]|nr:protein translocase subunit SecD [Melioribacteraceae bacterium]